MRRFLAGLVLFVYVIVLLTLLQDVLGWKLFVLILLIAGLLQSAVLNTRPDFPDPSIPRGVWGIITCSAGLLILGGRQSWVLGERLHRLLFPTATTKGDQ